MDINTFQLKMLGKSLLKLNYRRTGDSSAVSAHLCRPGHFQRHALRKSPGGRHHQPGPGHGSGSKSGEPDPPARMLIWSSGRTDPSWSSRTLWPCSSTGKGFKKQSAGPVPRAFG